MKQRIKFIFTTWFIAISLFTINAQDVQTNKNDMENLNLTNEWDKTFPQSDKVKHSKVTFRNRYGITLAADLYMPKNAEGKLPAIAICGPFGAVKEQASGLYAQTMAERGFLTIAFDPSFTGESGGAPRYVASPDINTEDFSAAVDFLSLRDDVDSERIGIIGICGWGGLAINAAAIDTRIKATVASTMYDMSRCTANGYFDETTMPMPVMKCADNSAPNVPSMQKRFVCHGRRCSRSTTTGCTAIRKRLSCLLQNFTGLPFSFVEL